MRVAWQREDDIVHMAEDFWTARGFATTSLPSTPRHRLFVKAAEGKCSSLVVFPVGYLQASALTSW